MEGTGSLSKLGRQTILPTQRQRSCRASSVIALAGVDFDHHDQYSVRIKGEYLVKNTTDIRIDIYIYIYIYNRYNRYLYIYIYI